MTEAGQGNCDAPDFGDEISWRPGENIVDKLSSFLSSAPTCLREFEGLLDKPMEAFATVEGGALAEAGVEPFGHAKLVGFVHRSSDRRLLRQDGLEPRSVRSRYSASIFARLSSVRRAEFTFTNR